MSTTSTNWQTALTAVREEIDAIDAQLLVLLNRRARCAQQVGEIKANDTSSRRMPAYRPEREAQVLRRIQAMNEGPLPDDQVMGLFRELMSSCLALEQPLSVAFLGPLGSFTGAAAAKHFGRAARLLPELSIDDVFRALESGQADYGVVPIENSTEGAVGRSMDLLLASPLKICGEVVTRIHQNLLTPLESLSEIKRIYSHTQSFAQCHDWLNRHLPNAARLPAASNSQAVELMLQDAGSAAIAGEIAATFFQVPVLAKHIEDDPNNTTRFIVLGRSDAGVSGKDKTSLVMSAPNRTGALHALLTPLVEAGLSMTRLESRPARHTLWDYVFFVDIDGHCQTPAVAQALQELGQRAAFLKVLGSYPAAVLAP